MRVRACACTEGPEHRRERDWKRVLIAESSVSRSRNVRNAIMGVCAFGAAGVCVREMASGIVYRLYKPNRHR